MPFRTTSLFISQVFVNRPGGFAPAHHGGDDQVRPGDAVSAGEDALAGGGAGLPVVDGDQPPVFHFQPRRGLAEDRVGPVAERQDGGVTGDAEVGAFHGDGFAAAFGVGFAQPHFETFHRGQFSVFARDEFDGLGQEAVFGAFFARHLAILFAAGHFVLGAAVQAGDFLGAEAQGGPQAVGGGVAAADDHHMLADFERLQHVRRKQAALHVAADQEVGRFENAGQVGAGGVFHFGVHFRADADEDCSEALGEQVVNGFVFADIGVRDEFDACALELLPFFLPDFLGKFEVGDAVHEQAARRGLGLEDGHFVSALDELVGATQTGRACADDGNLFPTGSADGQEMSLVAAFVVHREDLQLPGQHRGVVFVQHARTLAERLVRADASANFGQGTGLVVQVGGVAETRLFDQPHGRGDVVVRGAGQHAGRGVRAMDTARGFHHGALGVELDDDILEVAGALLGRTQIQFEVGFVGAGFSINIQEFAGDCLHERSPH